MTAHRCIAPIDDAAQQLCGARATTSRIVDGLVCNLCSAHAAELDHDHDQQSEEFMAKTIFGIRNQCFYASSQEDVRYYLTRKSRDAALAELRDLAVSRGLSASAARAGIYPVKRVLRDVTPGAEALIESASENERELAARVEVAS